MSEKLKYIGEIITPYKTAEECPSNINKNGPLCEIKLYDEYRKGLYGLKEGDSIMILYWFDHNKRKVELSTRKNKPSEFKYGTFALRSPIRPNPIAVSVLPIERITEDSIFVKGLDCISGTKLLDIKPAIYDETSLC